MTERSSLYPEHFNVVRARELKERKLSCDVLVVGSGAGGAITAEILAESGLKVIIVEEGPYRSQRDFNMLEREAYPELYQEAASRKTKDKAITILQGRAVGGSTTVNWTSSFRTPNQTLEFWQSRFGLSELSTESLSPWFESIERKLGIKPWALPPNPNNAVLARGTNKLGYHSAVIPRNVRGCANLGYCGMGCPLDAKQSMLVTSIPAALSFGAQLITRARVEQINTVRQQVRSVSLTAMDEKGQPISDSQLEIRPKSLVLSAGAIGSPAILLRSGLNGSGEVGKRTFLHPVTATAAIMPDEINAYRGAPQSIYSDEFLWPESGIESAGYKLEVPPIHPLIVSTLVPGHGAKHRELMQQFKHMHAMLALHRDGFSEQSEGGQVIINQDNLPVLDYPLNDYFWEAAKHSLLEMAKIQFAAGAKTVMPIHSELILSNNMLEFEQNLEELDMQSNSLKVFSAHVMGGCAMGVDPDESVVDHFGRHHEISNLRVIDGSVFPTSLGVNPQLTIYAMAARNATELANELIR